MILGAEGIWELTRLAAHHACSNVNERDDASDRCTSWSTIYRQIINHECGIEFGSPKLMSGEMSSHTILKGEQLCFMDLEGMEDGGTADHRLSRPPRMRQINLWRRSDNVRASQYGFLHIGYSAQLPPVWLLTSCQPRACWIQIPPVCCGNSDPNHHSFLLCCCVCYLLSMLMAYEALQRMCT